MAGQIGVFDPNATFNKVVKRKDITPQPELKTGTGAYLGNQAITTKDLEKSDSVKDIKSKAIAGEDILVPSIEAWNKLRKDGITGDDIDQRDGHIFIKSGSEFLKNNSALDFNDTGIEFKSGLNQAQKDSIVNLVQNKPRTEWNATDIANYNFATNSNEQVLNSTTGNTEPPMPPTITDEQPKITSITDQITDLVSSITTTQTGTVPEGVVNTLTQASNDVVDIQGQIEAFNLKQSKENLELIQAQTGLEGQGRGITSGIIAGQQARLGREASIQDAIDNIEGMGLEIKYNTALTKQMIAQGAYNEAQKHIQDTADNNYRNATLQLQALNAQSVIQDREAQRMQTELDFEYGLWRDGFTPITDQEGLTKAIESGQRVQKIGDKWYLQPVEGTTKKEWKVIGQDEYGNNQYGFVDEYTGNIIPASSGDTSTSFFTDANGTSWNIGGWATDPTKTIQMQNISEQIGKVTDANIDAKVEEFTPGITAEMIRNTSAKTGVSWEALMTMVTQESIGGTSNVALRNNNFGGLTWNNQDWVKQFGGTQGTARPETEGGNYISFPTKQAGLDAMGALMANYNAGQEVETPFQREVNNLVEQVKTGALKTTGIQNENLRRAVQSAMTGQLTRQDEIEIANLQDRYESLEGLATHEGLKKAVGAYKFARWTPLKIDKADVRDFVGTVEQLTAKDTLQTLINLKKAGGTLGALSQTELVMLQNAATKINSWAFEKDGKVIGYDISEKMFLKEINTLKTITTRALEQAGALPAGVGNSSYEDYLNTIK